MANPNPTHKISSQEEAKRLGRLGGIASGKTRKANKELKDLLKGGFYIPKQESVENASPKAQLEAALNLMKFVLYHRQKHKRRINLGRFGFWKPFKVK